MKSYSKEKPGLQNMLLGGAGKSANERAVVPRPPPLPPLCKGGKFYESSLMRNKKRSLDFLFENARGFCAVVDPSIVIIRHVRKKNLPFLPEMQIFLFASLHLLDTCDSSGPCLSRGLRFSLRDKKIFSRGRLNRAGKRGQKTPGFPGCDAASGPFRAAYALHYSTHA